MATQEPVAGLLYEWDPSNENFAAGMDANLLKIGTALQLSVADRNVTDPSTLTPADGDRYIVAAGAINAWSGKDDHVAVWRAGLSAWEFYAPSVGWVAYVEDEDVLSVFKSTGWSTGIAM